MRKIVDDKKVPSRRQQNRNETMDVGRQNTVEQHRNNGLVREFGRFKLSSLNTPSHSQEVLFTGSEWDGAYPAQSRRESQDSPTDQI